MREWAPVSWECFTFKRTFFTTVSPTFIAIYSENPFFATGLRFLFGFAFRHSLLPELCVVHLNLLSLSMVAAGVSEQRRKKRIESVEDSNSSTEQARHTAVTSTGSFAR